MWIESSHPVKTREWNVTPLPWSLWLSVDAPVDYLSGSLTMPAMLSLGSTEPDPGRNFSLREFWKNNIAHSITLYENHLI